ncbi:MAG: DNA translocase FtsK, partial [Myxococcota bacterium]|nr:DNA translocase FtsK [Myxococcota bacterium]
VLGVDWGDMVSTVVNVVEAKLPNAWRRVMTQARDLFAGGASVSVAALRVARDRVVHALPKHPVESADSPSPEVAISIGHEGPLVGAIPTPTVEPNEVFVDIGAANLDLPDEEPADNTVVQLPELVEVEWGTEAGVEVDEGPIHAPSDLPERPLTADPVSLDAALLAAAVDAPEPTYAPISNAGVVEPAMPETFEPPSGVDEPGLLSDPEDAPTVPPLDEPVVHNERSLEIVAQSHGTNDGPEITPGDLVSGGTMDDGRAIVVPEVRTPFELPHLDLLDKHPRDVASFDREELTRMSERLKEALRNFKVDGEVVAIRPGPVITTFEFKPAPGIKVSKIAGLQDDIAMALKALRVRIIAPIPKTDVVGIEIPSSSRQIVWIRDMIASEAFKEAEMALPMALGKTVDGRPRVADLAKMPHLLVGGTTGSGKSVGVNSMLLSLLYTRTPEELRMILVDPKMLEFEMYRDIPHLLHPVVTEPKLASAVLKWACTEMDDRYRQLTRWKVRNIENYNAKVDREMEDWTPAKARKYAPKDWPEHEPLPPPKRMPYLVIVIDELADLMMVAAKDVEESIIRIAQKARAAGIHLIVATQRPSVNVITGLIKANMPSRIAFQVRTKIDGRTILDQNGAEALLGKGDMLFLPPGTASLERLHGAFVSDDEVNGVTDFVREQAQPVYEAEIRPEDGNGRTIDEDEYDELYDEALAFVVESGKASSSMIQRKFKIGYNRAARIIEVLEQEGVIGPADGARPREILVGRTG